MAQNITTVEYFFDADPGFGSGTAVGITPSPSISNLTFPVNLSSAADGFHTLFIRAKDANNNWSIPFSKPFYKLSSSGLGSTNIVKLEYFFDSDPGYGAGFDVPITPGTSITNHSFAISLSSVADGFHTLFVRSKDANNNWSIPFSKPFFKLSASSISAANINKLEYFFDSDPGYGAGTNVAITPATALTDFNFSIPLNSLSDGFHTLIVRARDANGNWSVAYSSPFYKLNAPVTTAPNINKLEYFFDADPGFGAGTNVPITTGTSINDHNFTIPLTSASNGFHTLTVRARDANGNWSTSFTRHFYKLNTSTLPALPNINKIEYFVDSDPGFGSGTDVPITAGVSISDKTIVIPMSALAEGNHKITVRARDVNGSWSVVAVQSFIKCNHPGTTLQPTSNITSSGFTASWTESPGSIGYQIDVSTDNFKTFVSGYNAKAVTAPATSLNVTGLSQASTYQYRVRAVATCVSVNSSVSSLTTLATPPSAQPTNLQFTSVTGESYTVFFTAPFTPPTGYLVIRKTGSSPTFTPVNNTTYTLGQTVGDGVVAYVGANFLFNETGMTANTQYFYDVFAYNIANGLTTYLITSPLENSILTKADEPAAQPTNLNFTSVSDVSMTVNFTGSMGGADGYLVLRKVGSAPTSVPVDGTSYSTTIGSDDIVYQGPLTSFNDTGLTQNTNYFYTIYAYNGSGTSINYKTTSPLQGNQLTPIGPPSSPSNLTFSDVTPTSLTLSFSAAEPTPSGYLIIKKAGSNPTFVPQTNTTYTSEEVLSDGIVAYVGSSLSLTETGLTPATAYFYDVYAFNQNGPLISYQIIEPLEGSKTTFTMEPTAQPDGITFREVTPTSMKITFTHATPQPSGYIVLRKASAAPTETPEDGTAYDILETIGEGTVAYTGADNTFMDNDLLPGTNYFYQVFSYNGDGFSTNYLTTVTPSNSASNITIADKPVFSPASDIGQHGFTINWVAATGASSYRIDVSKDSFENNLPGFNDREVTGTSIVVDGLESGTEYQYRLRAVNASGTSENSDEAQQFTIPATPVFEVATDVGQTSFSVNWDSVVGVDDYFLDVSESNTFDTFVTDYQNKALGKATTEVVSGLKSGTVYYYRLRAANSGGSSPYTDPIGSQLLIPATPSGLGLDGQPSNNSFTAKWNPVVGATEYRIDVTLAKDNFAPCLPGYYDKRVDATEEPEENVGDLTASTAYKFRVRAVNSAGTSPNSLEQGVTTGLAGTGFPLGFDQPQFVSPFNQSSPNISIRAVGGVPPYSQMTFYYRKITSNDFAIRSLPGTGGAMYQTEVDATMLDEVGVEFYFKVSDGSGSTAESARFFMYRGVSPQGEKIPFTKYGGTAQSYEIFSIPYTLSDNLVASVFEELGPIDKSKWRLVRYQGGKNVDLGIANRIEPGKGYWFNRKENIEISFSGGTIIEQNQSKPFEMQLESGWNQIGNPLPFDIKWNDVLAANPDVTLIGNLKVFNSSGFHLNDESNTLTKWSGGFVHNGNNSIVNLKIPVTLRNSAGGRTSKRNNLTSKLNEPSWFVPIAISQNTVSNYISGIGMHPEADLLIDEYDDFVAPRFINYLEFYANHENFFTRKFSRDVVPTSNSYTWTIEVESNNNNDPITLSWDNQGFGMNEAELLMLDISHNILVNMRLNNSYTFKPGDKNLFKFFYGSNSNEIRPDISTVGNAYPNPFVTQTTIPFLTSDDVSEVTIEILDVMGKPVNRIINDVFKKGIYQATWNGEDESGVAVASGIYFYRTKINNRSMIGRVLKH